VGLPLPAESPSPTEAQWPLASWPAFCSAVEALRGQRISTDEPLDTSRFGLDVSARKQVVAALRALNLIDGNGVPRLAFRRLVGHDGYSVVVDALEERFPHIGAAIAAGAPADELRYLISSAKRPASSATRFWRFLTGAYVAAGRDAPPALGVMDDPDDLVRPQATTETRKQAAAPTAPAAPLDDALARALLEREGESYSAALDRFLEAGEMERAATASARLEELRAEARRFGTAATP
jgi:hypothetical protein